MKKILLLFVLALACSGLYAQKMQDLGVATSAAAGSHLYNAGAGSNLIKSITKANLLKDYATLADAIMTGTFTFPTPFTIGAISTTATGTQINYLKDATGTTGTATTNLVYSDNPTLSGSVGYSGATSGTTSLVATDIAGSGTIRLPAVTGTVNMLTDEGAVVIGSVDLNPTISDGVSLGTTALMWSDLFTASGSVLNFDNGDVTLTHSVNNLEMGGGRLIVDYANPGDAAIYGYNSSATNASIGVKGGTFKTSGDGRYYGVYGIATGAAASATKVGVYGIATGGAINYAAYADGDIRIDDNIYIERDVTGNIDAAVGITEDMLSGFIAYTGGSAIDITANPQIVNPEAGIACIIIIQGSSDSNTLTFDDGNGLQLIGDVQCVLGDDDIIAFLFNGSDWFELYRASH